MAFGWYFQFKAISRSPFEGLFQIIWPAEYQDCHHRAIDRLSLNMAGDAVIVFSELELGEWRVGREVLISLLVRDDPGGVSLQHGLKESFRIAE